LIDVVKNVFKASLPPVYVLQYDDVDGDRIMLSGEEDYKAMSETKLPSSSKTMKVYITPLEESMISIKKDVSIISKSEASDNYQVVESQKNIDSPIIELKPEAIKETETSQISTQKCSDQSKVETEKPKEATKVKKGKKLCKDKAKKERKN